VGVSWGVFAQDWIGGRGYFCCWLAMFVVWDGREGRLVVVVRGLGRVFVLLSIDSESESATREAVPRLML